jgi:WD40 repeat protein
MLARPCLSPDGQTLALAGIDHTLHFLDLGSGKEVYADRSDTMPLTAVGWGPGGKRLWTLAAGKALRQWDAATGKEVEKLAVPVNTYNAVLSADGRFLATLPNWIDPLEIVEVATGKKMATPGPSKQQRAHRPAHMVFSPDGALLAFRFEHTLQLEIHSVAQGKKLHTLTIAPSSVAFHGLNAWPAMVFSPDGSLLAAYSEPEVLALWETKTGRQLTRLKLPGKMPFAGLAFTPDCRSLAVESHDGTVVLWELATGKERRVFAAKEGPAKPVPGGKPSRDGIFTDPFVRLCRYLAQLAQRPFVGLRCS